MIIRQATLPGFSLYDHIKESIDFLKSHEPPEGFFVGFSGGKDSIVTLELCRMAGVRHEAVYSCTRIDPPEVVQFIRKNYPEITWLYPRESFWRMIAKKSPPLRVHRWCCDELKKRPAKSHPLKHRIMGIRAEESARRAARPRIAQLGKMTLYKPIFRWPEWAVWEFIEQHGLAYPSLYDGGFSRIGCVVCPFMFGASEAKQRHIKTSMERWPGMWKAFEHAVKGWFVEKQREGIRGHKAHKTADEYWQAYLHGFEKQEAKL